MSDDFPLAAEFPPTTRDDWRRLVEAALKGASFDKRLVSETYDGLRTEPLYARAAGAKPVTGRIPGAAWTLMQRVDHPDPSAANEQALQDLENGATGLTLVMAGSVSANGYGLDASPATLARVLQDVKLDAGITIDFNLSPATRAAAQHFAALVQSRQLLPAAVDMRASINPVGGFAATGKSPQAWSAISKGFAGLIGELASKGFRGPFAVADGRIIHNAGGSEAQELSFVIASAVEYLRALETSGLPLDTARAMIYFRLSADADEFLTIAKFRALRKLWARIEEACALAPKPAYVAAETAWRMMTRRDPYVNMLRTTIAVAAAGVGGADSIVGASSHRGAGLTRPIRAPHRTQHPAHFARRVESREGRRSCRRLRRHRGSDSEIVLRRVDVVSRNRKCGRRMGSARSPSHPDERSPPCAPSVSRQSPAARTHSPAPATIPISMKRQRPSFASRQ